MSANAQRHARAGPKFTSRTSFKAERGQWPTAASRRGFFGRVHELERLKDLCNNDPESISIITGPSNTGKTALVQHFVGEVNAGRSYIHCRNMYVPTPGHLAQVLMRLAIPPVLALLPPGEWISSTLPALLPALHVQAHPPALAAAAAPAPPAPAIAAPAVAAALLAAAYGRPENASLPGVLAVYTFLLRALCRSRSRRELSATGGFWAATRQLASRAGPPPRRPPAGFPVLVLDEPAELMAAWAEHHPSELAVLLDFFVATTKRQGLGHVVLASSDPSFLVWLRAEIDASSFTSYAIGDVSERDAREYVREELQRQQQPALTDEEWQLVYEVCGGNLGDLGAAVAGWKRGCAAALQGVALPVHKLVRRGCQPAAGAGYTAAHYATAVRALLDSPRGGAVGQAELVAQLGGSRRPLDAMVAARLLALRTPSPWALDIPPAAFEADASGTLVTAPSAVHLHAMRRLRASGALARLTACVEP